MSKTVRTEGKVDDATDDRSTLKIPVSTGVVVVQGYLDSHYDMPASMQGIFHAGN